MKPPQRPTGLRVWTPLLFSLVMIVGMVLGYRLHDTLRGKRNISTVISRSDRLDEIIDLIDAKYVDSVQTDMLYEDAVRGILAHLDPHTVYIPAAEVAQSNENLEGSFYGVGIEYRIVNDTIQVTGLVDDGPAEKSGVILADKIIRVNDSLVAGKGITADRISRLLRGARHTTVRVVLQDAVKNTPRHVLIERDEIPLYSIDASLMLDKETGYIKIVRFAATTAEEFEAALKRLKKQGMKRLVIDLRDNPGGYLDAAVDVLDELIEDNKLLVYMKGLHAEKEEFKARSEGLFEKGPLAILIDEGSASASEIVAGAVQDWDRGVIIGRRSFGKGLVQEQYDLSDGAALRLTVARYYTPSGRSIQRSFAAGKEAYARDFQHRFETGELIGADSLVKEDTATFYTSRHRVVHGGGGIKPDYYVPYDSTLFSTPVLSLVFSETMDRLLWEYYVLNRSELATYRSIDAFRTRFDKDEELLQHLVHLMDAKERPKAIQLLKNEKVHAYVLLQIRAGLARILFKSPGYYSIEVTGDNGVQTALRLFNSGQYLKLIGR